MKSLLILISCLIFGCSVGGDAPPTERVFTDVFALSDSGQILHSPDKGVTWVIASPVPSNASVRFLAMRDTNLLAATDSGVFETSDNGVHWRNNFAGYLGGVSCILSDGSAVYEGTDDGLYRSSDNGRYWQVIEGAVPIKGVARFQGRYFASIENNGGLLRSPEGGGPNWSYLKLDNVLGGTPMQMVSSNRYFFVVAHGGEIMRTSDYGDHWEDQYRTGLMCSSGSSLMSYGWLSQDDGDHWQKITAPPGPLMCLDRDFAVCGSGGQLYRSLDLGDTWHLLTLPSGVRGSFVQAIAK